MRIRKHARITNSSLSGGSLFKSHLICQLNQSPWDIITFPPPPSHSSPLPPPPPPPPPPYQFDGNESYNENGSFPNSVAAIESVDSMKLAVKVEETDRKVVKREEKRREAQKSHTMSNRQLAQMKNYDTLAHPSISKSAASNKPTRAQKATSIAPSDRNEFYYYSGFGPRWGKKRDAGTSITHKRERGAVEPVKTVAVPHYSSSEIDDDDEEEEDEDEDENNRGNRKTTRRKPIKARSLKDLCEVMG